MLTDGYENFTESQLKTLKKYVTNCLSNIFVLRNLPEVIKGALFSRYSRSTHGLRTLLLEEFILGGDEVAFESIVGKSLIEDDQLQAHQQVAAIKKAQSFYNRILDGYGDDSIGELGGAHLAIENVSMIAAKQIEDSRIGGSPLEKSTRYIYFDQKINGEYLFHRERILMTSAYRDRYVNCCNMLFETYSKLIPEMTEMMEQRFPKDPTISKTAYTAAVRSKVLDCLRGLLPAATLTNMGIYGNGRFFEQLIHKLNCQNLEELQDIGKKSFEELSKVIPSFVRRSDPSHRTHQNFAQFYETMQSDLKIVGQQFLPNCPSYSHAGVRLVSSDPDCVNKVAAALLYSLGDKGLPEIWELCKKLSEDEIASILDSASNARENRRHKSPRALEHAEFTFDIVTDFGAYRDLHRHRTLSQERQLLSCNYGFYIPPEIQNTPHEKPYCHALNQAKEVYECIAAALPEEAQYVVPMAYNIRWYFHVNLRALQWMCELRSSPAGHPSYRHIAQTMAHQICEKFPAFERFFKFVDYDGYELGRLDQEQRKFEKQQNNKSPLIK